MKVRNKRTEYQDGEVQYKSEDFWNIIQNQKGKCAITGRELNALNTQIELKDPYKKKDIMSLKNHYAVEKSISYLARHYSESNIIKLAVEIIRYRGLELGYTIEKSKRNKSRSN